MGGQRLLLQVRIEGGNERNSMKSIHEVNYCDNTEVNYCDRIKGFDFIMNMNGHMNKLLICSILLKVELMQLNEQH